MQFRPGTYGNPRRLIKACFRAIAEASADTELPFSSNYLHVIEDRLFPGVEEGEASD